MGKGIVVAILFEGNPENIFYSGQVVSGNVHVELPEQLKTRGIRIEIIGNASVMWSEGSGNSRRHYRGHENYADFRLYLVGSEGNSNEIFLEPGQHTYPFSFLLPPTLPSSFQGEHGSVSYKMKAVIDRPMRIDEKAEVCIRLVRLLNLNFEPQIRKGPLAIETQTPNTGCCYSCCCIKGLPEINITLNRGCFVPEETIIVGGQVTNSTNTTISRVIVAFMERKQFCATNLSGQVYRSTYVTNVLASTQMPAIACGQVQNWDPVGFNVPPLVASRLDGCNIIHITYFIQVTTAFGKCCADSRSYQEVVIGHIPLEGITVTAQPQGYFPTAQPQGYFPGPPQTMFANQEMQENFGAGENNTGFELAEHKAPPYNSDEFVPVHKS